MRKKIYNFVKKYCTQKNIEKMILVLLSIVILIVYENDDKNLSIMDFLVDSELIISICIVIIGTILFNIIKSVVSYFCEDDAKVEGDVDILKKKYPMCDFYSIKKNHNDFFYPIEILWRKNTNESMNYIITDCETSFYKLPKQIETHFDEIFISHSQSIVYNQVNLRLKKFVVEENNIFLDFERSKYFDLLVTNRAMDTVWNNNFTVRELYEPGPYVSKLENSRLANHIGLNGIIETSDNFIVLVLRNSAVSVSKRRYGCSVSGSLKSQFALDKQTHKINGIDDIVYSVEQEIRHELKLEDKDYNDKINFSKDDIIAFYRDISEGGKPHLLFYKKIDVKAEDIKKEMKQKSFEDEKKVEVDGVYLKWIKHDDFMNADLYKDYMIVNTVNNGKEYRNDRLKTLSTTMGLISLVRDYLLELSD